jgi:hypothetical protein
LREALFIGRLSQADEKEQESITAKTQPEIFKKELSSGLLNRRLPNGEMIICFSSV